MIRLDRLFRLRLSLMNGVAALGGYCLFPGERSITVMLGAWAGVTLLAMGGAALNQVLERDIDALMERTLGRPLPGGEMTAVAAVMYGSGAIVPGVAVLYLTGGALPALLGLAALFWYLAVYTPLKLRSPLALLAGALCGAVPPVIGWCLAGGAPADFRIITLAGLFLLWQIPHFWQLQRRHAADYRRAGMPLFSPRPGMFPLWILALSAAALMLPAFGVIAREAALCYSLAVIVLAGTAAVPSGRLSYPCMNLIPLLVTVTLLASCGRSERPETVAAPASTAARSGLPEPDGEALFKQYCASCHPNGGNVSDPARTLHGDVLKRNHITSPEDVVRVMRRPISRMIRFDAATLPDRDAQAIAEYVLKAFR